MLDCFRSGLKSCVSWWMLSPVAEVHAVRCRPRVPTTGVTTLGTAQTYRLGVAMAFRPAALPPLGASPSVGSAQLGACTIFVMAKPAKQIDGQVRAVSALRAPSRTSLVGRGLRRQMGRDVGARAPWPGIAGVAPAACKVRAGQAA